MLPFALLVSFIFTTGSMALQPKTPGRNAEETTRRAGGQAVSIAVCFYLGKLFSNPGQLKVFLLFGQFFRKAVQDKTVADNLDHVTANCRRRSFCQLCG